MKQDFYASIQDPLARRRALAEAIGLLIDDLIERRGVPYEELRDKLGYIREASEIIKRFD